MYSVMLTGGRSAEDLYRSRFFLDQIVELCSKSRFFLTDERMVSSEHEYSNYGMILRVLFQNIPCGFFEFLPMFKKCDNTNDNSSNYSDLLPEVIDVLLLSMGEDGHIASLFPHSPALAETERKVVPVIGPKAPFQRLTITPPVIQAAKKVYVLAIGDEKRRKYEEALLDPEDISSILARLVLDRTWIFDLDKEIDLCPKL